AKWDVNKSCPLKTIDNAGVLGPHGLPWCQRLPNPSSNTTHDRNCDRFQIRDLG
ncbi:hypothetical protein CCACVL1_17236, partial [Corchorus capsularis]